MAGLAALWGAAHWPAAAQSALSPAPTVAAPVAPAPAQEVSRLVKSGKLDEALQKTDAGLAQQPRDAQLRFLKGVILSEQKKTPEAMDVFLKLTEDFPELPEPYNNLAVLHAQQGQYEKARAALELAIRTHPGYATAYENLGDVYAGLAAEAYGKAAQLEAGNAAARNKMSLARELPAAGGRKPGAK
jgi:tetratricopeptide (TPR) repeat protein